MAELQAPTTIYDVSAEHDESLPWQCSDEGIWQVTGFNRRDGSPCINHACVDVTYELEQPGAIAYHWKVKGADAQGRGIFDHYWYLRGSDGLLRGGEGFLEEREEYTTHIHDDLPAGTYKLTLGVFCLGHDGEVSFDLAAALED